MLDKLNEGDFKSIFRSVRPIHPHTRTHTRASVLTHTGTHASRHTAIHIHIYTYTLTRLTPKQTHIETQTGMHTKRPLCSLWCLPTGPSIKYVTLFLANFDTPSPCHTLSHISEPPIKYVTSRNTPP